MGVFRQFSDAMRRAGDYPNTCSEINELNDAVDATRSVIAKVEAAGQ